jgi:hypothetical protein
MKIKITLNGSGGELASQVVDVPESDDPESVVNCLCHDVIETWLLSAGDSIQIVTVQS